jgi:hypothetical protein
MATPPARRASSDPLSPEARELEASTEEGSDSLPAVPVELGLEADPGPEALAAPDVLPAAECECDDPRGPRGPMPAPNKGVDELLLDPSAPICRAWLRGITYSLAAGEPGST